MSMVRTFHYDSTVSADLVVACMWAAFGLALTSLFFAMGFGPEIGQALIAAG
jgi:hypothetical protein